MSDVRKELKCDGGEEKMLRKATRRAFIAIITLDGLIEAALHTHCLACVCVEMCVCVIDTYSVRTHSLIEH